MKAGARRTVQEKDGPVQDKQSAATDEAKGESNRPTRSRRSRGGRRRRRGDRPEQAAQQQATAQQDSTAGEAAPKKDPAPPVFVYTGVASA